MSLEQNRLQRESTLGEILYLENSQECIAAGHHLYLDFARVGAGDTYVGADLVSAWYGRNIRIFANLQRLAEPGDRILVIYGAGHAAILRELIGGAANMRLVEAHDYLPASL